MENKQTMQPKVQEYQAPAIEVISVKIESGFAASQTPSPWDEM